MTSSEDKKKEDENHEAEEEEDLPFIKERRSQRLEGTGVKLNVSTTTSKLVERPDLYKKYSIGRYNLTQGFTFPEKFKPLIPRDIPEFYDGDQEYITRMIRSLYFFRQCAVIGPTGTGKTHATYLLAALTGLPMWEINCGLQTSSYDLFGRFVGIGRENWVEGQIVSWCRYGGILYLDEANMMRQDVATRLNPVLDTRGHIVLTEKDGEIIPRHPAAYLIIAMNPFAPEFAGTKPLNVAFRRRMSVWIDFDYLSIGNTVAEQEVELVARRGRVPRETAVAMVRIGAELRRQYKEREIPYGPSVGDLCNWGLLVSDGVPPVRAGEETIVAMISDSPEVQDNVRRLIKLIFTDSSVSFSVASRQSSNLETLLQTEKLRESMKPKETESAITEEKAEPQATLKSNEDTTSNSSDQPENNNKKKKFSFKSDV